MKVNRSFKTEKMPQCPYTLRSHTQPSDGWVVSEVAGQGIRRARGRGIPRARDRKVRGAEGRRIRRAAGLGKRVAKGRGTRGTEGREVRGADGPGKLWRNSQRTTSQRTQRVDGQETGKATGRGRCWLVSQRPVGPVTRQRANSQHAHVGTSQYTHEGTSQGVHGTDGQEIGEVAGRGRHSTVSQGTQAQRAAGPVTSRETGQGAQGTSGQATQIIVLARQTNDQGTHTTSGRGGHRRRGGGAGRYVSWREFSLVQFTEDSVKGTSDESDMLTAEKLLAEYTRPVASPPDDNCSICIGSLWEPSGLCSEGENEGQEDGGGEVTGSTQACHPSDTLEFTLCHHVFHRECVVQLIKHARHHLQCPYCKTIHGVRVGNQPTTGQMMAWSEPQCLPGHPDAGTFVVKYSFQDGVQSRQHPNPGHIYRAHDFPRLAYLPTTDKGRKVLYLLREAWRRRLLFTVGTSATSGLSNVITWADIHHKTNSWSNHNGHGYPDPGYLDNVLGELWAAGVTEESMATDSGGVV